jgi:hypothetical protein
VRSAKGIELKELEGIATIEETIRCQHFQRRSMKLEMRMAKAMGSILLLMNVALDVTTSGGYNNAALAYCLYSAP